MKILVDANSESHQTSTFLLKTNNPGFFIYLLTHVYIRLSQILKRVLSYHAKVKDSKSIFFIDCIANLVQDKHLQTSVFFTGETKVETIRMSRSYTQKHWTILLLVIAQLLLVAHIHAVADDHAAEHCEYCLIQDHALSDNSAPVTFFVPLGIGLVINLLSRDLATAWVIRIHPRGPPA